MYEINGQPGKRVWPAELREWRGNATDLPGIHRDWNGYQLEYIGFVTAEAPPDVWPAVVQLSGPKYLWVQLRQVTPPGQIIYLRGRTEGNIGTNDLRETWGIGGLECLAEPWHWSTDLQAQVKRALEARPLMTLQATRRINRGGRPRGSRTQMDDATWREKASKLRQLVRHDRVTIAGAIVRLELNLSERQGREWIAELDGLEPEC